MFSKSTCAIGALAFIAGSNAHMVMNTPTPYGFSTLQTAPLNGEGYNFPCQSGSRTNAFDSTGVSNPMTAGESQPLKFTGSAVHGGGSCQLSVTYENPPPADKSQWKVIHSFIGACPASAAGNLVTIEKKDPDGRPTAAECTGDNQSECLKSFQFKIPEGLKNGNATLAWTWFNKLGNREMYMNCAPISISGGSEDDTYFNSLPELFVANIPGECTTADQGGIIGFPNPGDSVTYGEDITPGAEGSCPVGSSSGSSGSSGSSSSAAASSYAASTSAAPSSYAAESSAAPSSYVAESSAAPSSYAAESSAAPSSYAGLGLDLSIDLEQNAKTEAAAAPSTTLLTMTGYGSQPSASAVVATSVASSYVAQSYPTAVATQNASTDNSNGTCGSDKVSCPTPGAIMCIGDSQFGLCNIDYCAFPEALAAGTSCSNGVIGEAQVSRRSHRHRRSHSHAHRHNL